MAEIKRYHCDYCGHPEEEQALAPVNVVGFTDQCREQACPRCRGRVAEFISKQLFDRQALLKLGIRVPSVQPASTPQRAD